MPKGTKRKSSDSYVPSKSYNKSLKTGHVYRAKMIKAAAPSSTRSYRSANISTRGFLGMEKKYYDTALADATVLGPTDATNGVYDPSATSMISTPAQGDGPQNRDGKRCIIKSIQITGNIREPINPSTVDGVLPSAYMISLVQDTQTNAAQIASENVFTNVSADLDLAASPTRNLLFASRFKVLKTWHGVLKPSSSFGLSGAFKSHGDIRLFRCFLKVDMPINFNAGTTSSIANVIDNSLHIVAYTTTSRPQMSYNARIRFVG